MSFVFSHRTVNMVYKRVCRNCPISLWGAKYLVRLANHLADVHQLDHIQRRQYLQEAKLQPKVKVVVYESEADNSGKNHSTSTRNPVQTQETVYELSRSRRNEASFKAKAKRTTTKNKTNRTKQRKSNSWLRGHRENLVDTKGLYIENTQNARESEYVSETHLTLGLGRTVLLMSNQDWNKDCSVYPCVFVLFIAKF